MGAQQGEQGLVAVEKSGQENWNGYSQTVRLGPRCGGVPWERQPKHLTGTATRPGPQSGCVVNAGIDTRVLTPIN